jgi:hypothetical protein
MKGNGEMNLSRFNALLDHLEHGVLGHERFDFNFLNHFDDPKNAIGTACGSAGCALGELPIIDPDNWKFCYTGLLYQHGSAHPYKGAAEYFGISVLETEDLFDPAHVENTRWYNPHTKSSADPKAWTRYDVALHMRDYLAFVETL